MADPALTRHSPIDRGMWCSLARPDIFAWAPQFDMANDRIAEDELVLYRLLMGFRLIDGNLFLPPHVIDKNRKDNYHELY